MTGSVVPSAPDGLSRTSSAAGSGVGSSSDRPPRPATIAELAERALNDLWDPARDLKYWLRLAQKHRNEGKDLADHGKYEEAFVLFARSATIVLEKLPTHRDYNTLLTPQQRQNLGLVSFSSLVSSFYTMPSSAIIITLPVDLLFTPMYPGRLFLISSPLSSIKHTHPSSS
jgi:hypothetical protein